MGAGPSRFSRRTFLGAGVAGAAAMWLPSCSSHGSTSAAGRGNLPASGRFIELDAKVRRAMRAYGIPGVAVGLISDGKEYVQGYGVTNVNYPIAIGGNTVFRINSSTKTFTGTTLMRLVDQGKIDLDARVRHYLPDFTTSDAGASARVTVRQLLNHTAGWLGDDLRDYGPGDDALARYVVGMKRLPQLTPPGTTFAYNNAAINVAGRIIEVVNASTYEAAVKKLVLEPLGLTHSRFFGSEIVGFSVAASHKLVSGKPVVDPELWPIPRSNGPTGNLLSSARDQVRYAQFHLGDGRAADGTRLLSDASLKSMQSRPGAGGTLVVELDGMGVTWMLRPSAESVQVVQHGGAGAGQPSGFIMVPSRGFALTVLTNSDGGSRLIEELFYSDWALQRFAGVSNVPATPTALSPDQLAPYEGRYVAQQIGEAGEQVEVEVEFRQRDGQLRDMKTGEFGVAFYRADYGLDLDAMGKAIGTRCDFVRSPDGGVLWWRRKGRLYRHQQ